MNFKIKKGDWLGIKGPSGSGKSTLIDCALGLLKPTTGVIEVNGNDVYLNKNWHKIVSHVPQDLAILKSSYAENIALGIAAEKIDIEKVMHLVRVVGLEDVVKKDDNGLWSPLGRRGNRLSGGQKQRLAIARALYKSPQIVFLDESTSGIDLDLEDKLLKSLKQNFKGITFVIISHRNETFKHCDKIFDMGCY